MSLCCSVYHHIEITENGGKNKFFRKLGSIWSLHQLEIRNNKAHTAAELMIANEAAAPANEDPVDLTEDLAGESTAE